MADAGSGEEQTFTLHYESLETFFSGLDAHVGNPNPNLDVAMEREHCSSADSKLHFVTDNYHIDTTSTIEWWFVVSPNQGLEVLGLDHYPREEREDLDDAKEARTPKPLETFDEELRAKGDQLQAVGSERMLQVELIGARLYTGPCYMKYNTVLRGCSPHSPKALHDAFRRLTRGNNYVTTLAGQTPIDKH